MERKRCYGCMKLKSNHSVCEYCGYDESKGNEIHQLQAGTVLKEQYMIGRVLGQGGFGITYLGWDMFLDIPVAIKEYFPSGAVMRETSVTMDVVSYSGDVGVRFRNNRERFLREAKMLARFADVPEIVQIKNFFLANNTAYIVMEYVDGITLKQYVRNRGGKLSVDETFSLIRPVIGALSKVHKSGMIHRDISPDNIMMLPEGNIKLLDFGAVRDVGEADVNRPLTKSTEAILKQGYAPIEQYQNRGSLGPWTDVYSLCATIYYCLTGEVPPDAPERLLGEEELNLKSKVPVISNQQEMALNKGMELRAQERIASMDDLYEQLYGFYEPDVIGKTEPVERMVAADRTEPVNVTVPVDKTDKVSTRKEEENKGNNKGLLLLLTIVVIGCLMGAMGVFKGNEKPVSEGTAVEVTSVIAEGECGENLYWTLDEEGILILDGEGQMQGVSPWSAYRDQIKAMILKDGVTSINADVFAECKNLMNVSIGPDTEIVASEEEYDFNSNLTLHVYEGSPARDFAYLHELYFVYIFTGEEAGE